MMQILTEIAAFSLSAFFLLLFVSQLVAGEIGFALGRRRAAQHDSRDEGVGLIVGSVLGLLAFVLAFNLSIATNRHSERRLASLEEGNAISTGWLQARAIGGPDADAIAALLERYVTERIIFARASRHAPEIDEANARSSAIQTEIWGHMTSLLAQNPQPEAVSLMNALNGVFDATTAMRFALQYTMPVQLVLLLLSLTVFGTGLVGYQFGLIRRPHRVLSLLMSLLWTAVVVEILDIGTPRIGVFRTDTFAYEWTTSGFGPIPVPPRPD